MQKYIHTLMQVIKKSKESRDHPVATTVHVHACLDTPINHLISQVNHRSYLVVWGNGYQTNKRTNNVDRCNHNKVAKLFVMCRAEQHNFVSNLNVSKITNDWSTCTFTNHALVICDGW